MIEQLENPQQPPDAAVTGACSNAKVPVKIVTAHQNAMESD